MEDKKTIKGKIKFCYKTEFHGIDCIEEGDNYGFEGCYNGDVNHPDPRPAHRIWINKIHAEKLFRLFVNSEETEVEE